MMNRNFKRLPRSFYARDTHAVAKELLGKVLVRTWRGKEMSGRITEVESYVGRDDRACHAAKGRTKRTEVMFGDAGHAYVYLIYGMYHCLNIVTEHKEFPAAILIRGVVPVRNITAKTDGPGKLTRAMHITCAHNTEDLTASERLYIADDGASITKGSIKTSLRIGVEYAGADALLPWRYYIEQQPSNTFR